MKIIKWRLQNGLTNPKHIFNTVLSNILLSCFQEAAMQGWYRWFLQKISPKATWVQRFRSDRLRPAWSWNICIISYICNPIPVVYLILTGRSHPQAQLGLVWVFSLQWSIGQPVHWSVLQNVRCWSWRAFLSCFPVCLPGSGWSEKWLRPFLKTLTIFCLSVLAFSLPYHRLFLQFTWKFLNKERTQIKLERHNINQDWLLYWGLQFTTLNRVLLYIFNGQKIKFSFVTVSRPKMK